MSEPAARPPRRGCGADGHRDEREDQAGKREGEATLEFHARIAPAGAVIVEQAGDGFFCSGRAGGLCRGRDC